MYANIDKLAGLMRLNSNIYRCSQVYLDRNLAKFNLSMGTYPYLLVLKRLPGISQNYISRELSVDKAMSARTIKKLIDEGYIRKEENKDDIRAYKLYITEKAQTIIPEILKIVHEWIDMIVPKDEADNKEIIETAITFLEQVLDNSRKYKCCCNDKTKGVHNNE
ncbi:MarR family winged helix-turn-helix transcriptional regulator [Clostridium oryzae]|uniref:Transcriptional regulator SlyA n=1 Tax=Clostridium oryzae TaxID=1450648 RepID=A0A1V4IBQ5_9CLOT|nr:MarR family winged helix-turn-helix transcriptional regulator [Clostridium oryzae]OPJ57421.1 transcriptional regulator SlyA [Clostridium oryzae]